MVLCIFAVELISYLFCFIAEKKYPPQGNWVWLKFTSRMEAGRALALNGRVFSGGLMVGVLPCTKSPNNINSQINKFETFFIYFLL